MVNNQGKGWYGDSEGHAEAAKQRDKLNWWPLLAIPVALAIGWFSNDAIHPNNQAYSNSQQQYGVGGGPATPCTTPGMTNGQ